MKAGGLQTIRTMGALEGWRYQSRDRKGAHIQNKMADGVDDLLLRGDDFKVILDTLEGEEAIEQQFLATANNLSSNCANLRFEFLADSKLRPGYQ